MKLFKSFDIFQVVLLLRLVLQIGELELRILAGEALMEGKIQQPPVRQEALSQMIGKLRLMLGLRPHPADRNPLQMLRKQLILKLQQTTGVYKKKPGLRATHLQQLMTRGVHLPQLPVVVGTRRLTLPVNHRMIGDRKRALGPLELQAVLPLLKLLLPVLMIGEFPLNRLLSPVIQLTTILGALLAVHQRKVLLQRTLLHLLLMIGMLLHHRLPEVEEVVLTDRQMTGEDPVAVRVVEEEAAEEEEVEEIEPAIK